MKARISGNANNSKQRLEKSSPLKDKPASEKLTSPTMKSKQQDVVEKSAWRRFKGDLELGREVESDEEITSDALPNQIPRHSHAGREKAREKETLAEVPIGTHTPIDRQDSQGRTQLMLAIDGGFTKTAKYLIEKGANIHLTDSEGNTALLYAAKKGLIEIAGMLLKYKADINFLKKWDGSALTVAIESKNDEMAKMLIDNGANVNLSHIKGETPLITAVRHSDTSMVRDLINNGAVVDIRSSGNTALDIAVRRNDQEKIKLLIEAGNHIDGKSHYYQSAYLTAIREENFAAAKLLGEKIDLLSLDEVCEDNFLKSLASNGTWKAVRTILNDATKPKDRIYARSTVLSMQEAFMDAPPGNPQIASLLFEKAVTLDILNFDELAQKTCALIRAQRTREASDTTWTKFRKEILSEFNLGEEISDILMKSAQQYASVYANLDQEHTEITEQQLKMLFSQSIASAEGLHDIVNDADRSSKKSVNHPEISPINPSWVARILLDKAEREINLQQKSLSKFLYKLSPSTTTAQLRETAREAGWHPVIIKLLTDIWTSLSRRRTKENFFATLNTRINSGEIVRKIERLESDAARHVVTLQFDTLRSWMSE